MKTVLAALISILALAADAAVPVSQEPKDPLTLAKEANEETPMSFADWKQEQITMAVNKVTRLANKIKILESNQFVLEDRAQGGLKPSESEQLTALSREKVLVRYRQDLKMVQESLKYSEELTFEDYLVIYVRQYKSDSRMMAKIVKVLTPEQQTQLLQMALDGGAPTAPAPLAKDATPAITELESTPTGASQSTL